MLDFSSAQNTIVASVRAMRTAVRDSLAGLDREPSLLIYYTTMGHDLPALLETAEELCPDAEIVGCSGGGVVGKDGASETMRSLGVMAVSGDDFAVAHADSIRGDTSYEVAAEVAAELKEKAPDTRFIHILASGIDIAGDRALEGIASVFGPEVLVFGGTSGDNLKMEACYQFAGGQVLERGIVLVGFTDPTLELHTAVHHGSVRIGRPFTVTKSEANRIDELDGKPAWPTLMDRLDLPVESTPAEVVAVMALGQAVPEELAGPYANHEAVHTVFLVDDDHQSFFLPASCPEGTKLWLMERDEELIFDGTEAMIGRLVDELGGQTPTAVFHTDCGARGRLRFDKISKDELMSKIQDPICGDEDVPWLGLYGFGEFTPVAGVNRFHTQTSSLYVMVRTS